METLKAMKQIEILIIGGTGVLSSAVVVEAIHKGFNVTIINRGRQAHRIPKGVELIIADAKDKQTISEKLGKRSFDAVIDFICYTDTQTTESFQFYHHYTSQYFFISSCAVYDSRIKGICDEEAPKVMPLWWYSKAKWQSEEHLIKLAANTTTSYTIVRPSITYGDTRIPYGISPMYGYHWTLVERMRHNKPILTWNKGLNRSNMMRVEDFAVGLVGLIGNPKAINESFNICGDEAPQYLDVLNAVSEYTQNNLRAIDVTPEFYAEESPNKSGEILCGRALDSINDNSKIKKVVPEFRQKIGLLQGIGKTIEAYRNQNFQKGIDWAFDGETDRIAKKWCKNNGIDTSQFKFGFIDYFDNATLKDKFKFYQEYHKDRTYMKILNLFFRVLCKLRLIKL